MARLVVLRFEDNNQAETLVEDWHTATSNPVRLLTPGQENDVECNIVGLFGAPTKFCDSSDGHLQGKKKTERGFVRGMKWGWWVCAVCKKPTQAWGNHLPGVLSASYNLLKTFLAELETDDEAAVEEVQKADRLEQSTTQNETVIIPLESSNRGSQVNARAT